MRIKSIQIVHAKNKVDNLTLFKDTIPDIEKFCSTTGIRYRYQAHENHKIEDYFVQGINALNIEISSIDVLITVSQTPTKLIPSVSNYLNQQLRFSEDILTYDLTSGCSGYTEALVLANQFFQTTSAKRIVVCNGDFSNHIIDEENTTVKPLFSDVAAITLLERSKSLFFSNQKSYADGYSAISSQNGKMTLNGLDVFQFSTLYVAKSIQELLTKNNIDPSTIAFYFFHQANQIINQTIAKQLKISPEKVSQSLTEYGNSSSASIPLTLALQANQLKENQKILLSGFGVGFKICNVVTDFYPFDANITAFEDKSV